MQIKIDIRTKDVEKKLQELASSVEHRKPLMRAVSEAVHAAVMKNFDAQGRPAWKKTNRGGMILQDSGRLLSSISTYYDNNTAAVGTNVEYAAIHQFGGKTKPHMIRPKRAKALSFGGRTVKSVKHPGSNIPARPFLSLTDSDMQDIEYTIEDYLKNILD